MQPFPALLGDPAAYLAQMNRLRTKYGRMRRPDALSHRGLRVGDLGYHDRDLARRLARAVTTGNYVFGPVVVRPALIGGKRRSLCRSNLIDTIVLGVLAQVLSNLVEPVLSPRVYSYRMGRSSWQALSDLKEYFATHRRERPDVRARGLYVLHRDVRAYGESIPTGDESALWAELRAAFAHGGLDDQHWLWGLTQGAMRPEARTHDGSPPPRIGVPTGSPVQTVACNLYLARVDRFAGEVPGAFYARFGDDMLFCHPDPDVARDAARVIDEAVRELGLEVKAEKRQDLHLTGAGRRSVGWEESRPTTEFDYLGFRLDLEGRVKLKADKARRVLRELRARAENVAAVHTDGPLLERTRAVCGALARALDPTCPLADPVAQTLRYVLTDRGHLEYLDHAIALLAAETIARKRGPRAFRTVPYHFLRREGALPSLVASRNRTHERGAP